MEKHNWGEISKVFAKMFEHVKTIIPGKIPMKSSKKTQTVGELISFSPAGWNILVVAAPEFSWPEFVPRILLLMATAHLRLCLQHNEHVAAKSSRNVISVRNVVIEQALWGGATHMRQNIATKISKDLAPVYVE